MFNHSQLAWVNAIIATMERPSLTDLSAFTAVAERRSFRKAADDLGMSASTLSRAIRELEERLGVRLLHRTTRSVSTTEAGAELFQKLQFALTSLDEALESVSRFRGAPSGTVRINASRAVAKVLVEMVLPMMTERYPEVTVDIVAEGRLVDIVLEGFDAGVRLVETVPQDMIGVTLDVPVRFVCVASPDYLQKMGEPKTPEDLSRHRCIRHRMPGGKIYRWEFERAGQTIEIDPSGTLILDEQILMVEAASKGLGIAYVSSIDAETYVSSGALQEVLQGWTATSEKLVVYYPGHRRVPPALRAFLDCVKAATKAVE